MVSFVSFTHRTAHIAPLCMVLEPFSALDGTRGRAAVQQVNASFCKDVRTLATSPH